MRHIKNLEQWYKVPASGILVYRGDMERTTEVELNVVGPCVVYVQRIELDELEPDPKQKAKWIGEKYLLGVIEGLDAFRWRLEGNFALSFDASGEVWARRDQSPVSYPNPDSEVYTRFEKSGLYVDELGTLMHRQAVLHRLNSSQAMGEERRENSALLKRLEALTKQVEALTPKASEAPTKEEKTDGEQPQK